MFLPSDGNPFKSCTEQCCVPRSPVAIENLSFKPFPRRLFDRTLKLVSPPPLCALCAARLFPVSRALQDSPSNDVHMSRPVRQHTARRGSRRLCAWRRHGGYQAVGPRRNVHRVFPPFLLKSRASFVFLGDGRALPGFRQGLPSWFPGAGKKSTERKIRGGVFVVCGRVWVFHVSRFVILEVLTTIGPRGDQRLFDVTCSGSRLHYSSQALLCARTTLSRADLLKAYRRPARPSTSRSVQLHQAPSKDGMTPGVAMLPPATKGFSAAQPRKPCRALENPSTSTSPPSKRRRSTGAEIPHLQ